MGFWVPMGAEMFRSLDASALDRVIHQVMVFASATAVQRTEVVVASFFVVMICEDHARREVRNLANISLSNFVERIPGPRPSVCESLKRRKSRLKAFANRKLFGATLRLLFLFVCGFAIPTAMLAGGVKYHDWLLPDRSIFVSRSDPARAVNSLNDADIACFVGGQFFGVISLGATDAFAVIEAPIAVKHGEALPAGLLWACRLFVGAYEFIALWVFAVLGLVFVRGPRELQELDEQIAEACKITVS